MIGRAAIFLVAAAAPQTAIAGAWPTPSGEAQVIVKVEIMRGADGFDADGSRRPMPDVREDAVLSLFAEYGLTEALTFQVKVEHQDGRDAFVDFSGRGPVEIGLRWRVWGRDGTSLSLYGGYLHPGEGRNAGYAAPGEGDGDWEVRVLAGHGAGIDALGGRHAFVEAQAARRFRTHLPDEDRLDLTVGVEAAPGWTVMAQAFAGRSRADGGAEWLVGEMSVVRRFGDWSLQAGWRRSLAGREAPAQSGPVLAVWRRF